MELELGNFKFSRSPVGGSIIVYKNGHQIDTIPSSGYMKFADFSAICKDAYLNKYLPEGMEEWEQTLNSLSYRF